MGLRDFAGSGCILADDMVRANDMSAPQASADAHACVGRAWAKRCRRSRCCGRFCARAPTGSRPPSASSSCAPRRWCQTGAYDVRSSFRERCQTDAHASNLPGTRNAKSGSKAACEPRRWRSRRARTSFKASRSSYRHAARHRCSSCRTKHSAFIRCELQLGLVCKVQQYRARTHLCCARSALHRQRRATCSSATRRTA